MSQPSDSSPTLSLVSLDPESRDGNTRNDDVVPEKSHGQEKLDDDSTFSSPSLTASLGAKTRCTSQIMGGKGSPFISGNLWRSWFSFVRFALREEGLQSYLPRIYSPKSATRSSSSCFCRKSWISYPHWPPSTYEEAVEHLYSLLHSPRPHRPSLASCWLSFLSRTEWAQRRSNSPHDDSDDDTSMVRLLRKHCPILSFHEDSFSERRQAQKWQRK